MEPDQNGIRRAGVYHLEALRGTWGSCVMYVGMLCVLMCAHNSVSGDLGKLCAFQWLYYMVAEKDTVHGTH